MFTICVFLKYTWIKKIWIHQKIKNIITILVLLGEKKPIFQPKQLDKKGSIHTTQ